MICEKSFGGCFKVSCVRSKICQEKKSDVNYEVTITIQKTYKVNAESKQEALNIVVGRGGPHASPLPDKTLFVKSNVREL